MKIETIVIATRNKGKFREFARLLDGLNLALKSLSDYPAIAEIPEHAGSFKGNARTKAETVCRELSCCAVADDSGLVVDALDGQPGIFSARYAGKDANDERNIAKLLEELRDVPEEKRTARFVCVAALARPGEETVFFEGSCEGKITGSPRYGPRKSGFGYDPVFLSDDLGKTFSEAGPEEKNRVSHRAKAAARLRAALEALL